MTVRNYRKQLSYSNSLISENDDTDNRKIKIFQTTFLKNQNEFNNKDVVEK